MEVFGPPKLLNEDLDAVYVYRLMTPWKID